uniref:Uncharacterized protein n=1 Tax=Arundo donax TaxID=35708 RepID=A0A0A9BGR2_ARUDO
MLRRLPPLRFIASEHYQCRILKPQYSNVPCSLMQ